MKLSKMFKDNLKQMAVKVTLVATIAVVLFTVSMNLDSVINTIKEQFTTANSNEILGNSEVYITKDSNGYGLDITANDDSGVRKIEVYQGSNKIKELNFGGTNEIEYAKVNINAITFGSTETITTKVNGVDVDAQTLTNTRYISTAQDLCAFRDRVNAGNDYAGKTVELTNDIDLSSVCYKVDGTVENDVSWISIGAVGGNFKGTFSGNYYTIKSLYINQSNVSEVGLFRRNCGNIQNLKMDNVYIYSFGNEVSLNMSAGAFATQNYGFIKNCGINSGTITVINTSSAPTSGYRSLNAGGIVGGNRTKIENCYNKASIYAKTVNTSGANTQAWAGGIASLNDSSESIINCYNFGNVSAEGTNSFAGGIGGAVSWFASTTYITIQNCYNTGTISCVGYNCCTGSIIGNSTKYITIKNSYYSSSADYTQNRYQNGSPSISNVSRVDSSNLKNYASTLGSAYVDDTYHINDGYPILRWQVEAAGLNARHEYLHVGDTYQLRLDTSVLPFTNDVLTWHSYDECIATVDSNGLLRAVGDGYTTVWAEYSQYNIKVMAIINVAKRGAVAFAQIANGAGTSGTAGTSIVLKEDGTVWASGNNESGQLGNGTYVSSTEPVQVMIDKDTPLKNIVKIGMGRETGIALSKSGEVYAWGDNTYGCIGNNSTSNCNYATKVLGIDGNGYLNDVVDISAGAVFNMAMFKDGTVCAWGDNSSGELGQGNTTTYLYPKLVQIEKCVQVSAGQAECSVVTQNGWIYSWGYGGSYGSLLTGNNNTQLTPYNTGVENITYTNRLEFVIVTKDIDKNVKVAGFNANGQLGNGGYTNAYSLVPVNVQNDSGVMYVGGTSFNVSLLMKDGTIWTAGGNKRGQIANGSTAASINSFTQAKNIDGSYVNNAKNISKQMAPIGNATSDNWADTISYISNDGYVYSSGANNGGNFGNGTTSATNVYYTKMGVDCLNYLKNDIVLSVDESYSINRNDFKIQEFNVSIDYQPKNVGNLTFSTEDTNITVTSGGKVTGVSEGYAKVKVTDTENNLETYITVKVVNDKNMALEIGKTFSVGLTTSGQVWTWGSNIYGELGTNTEKYSVDEPEKIKTISNIVDIGAGNYHAVALDNSGNVYTWGLNNIGQLGNNSTENSKAPTKITGLSNIVKVDAYKNITTALDSSGNLYAWGEGYNKTPKKIYENVIDISGNAIITSDRRVRRLGEAVYIPGIRNAVKVSGSEDRLIVLQADGTVYSVDNNNTLTTLSVANTVDVSAGPGYGYILDKAGDVYTYGTATNGELGNGTDSAVGSPTKISDLSNVELVSCGEGQTGGVADYEGYMYTTGQNGYGQLGHGDNDQSNTFEIILNVALEANVDKVVEGIDESTIVDIGLGINLNLKKDLEEGSTSDISIVDDTIASLTKNLDETYTVTGKMIGRTFLNATITGNINGVNKQFATNVEVRIVPQGGITVPSIKSGQDFSIALKANGEVESWGSNQYGQLGVGNSENYDEPQLLDKIPETIVEIAVGDNHVLALTEEGTIYGWGLNDKGQVGNGTTANQLSQASVININGNELSKIIRVEAHGDNSFAINEDGEVFAWGKDFKNKAEKLETLENAIDVSTSYYVKADGTVYNIKNLNDLKKLTIVGKVRTMDEGVDHSVFLTTEGKIFAIGSNDYGQLGNGSTDIATNEVVAMRKDASTVFGGPGSNAIAIAVEAGDRYSIILTSDGDVYTTGLNQNGRLGLPLDTINVLTPVKSENINNVMLISGGNDHAVVALKDGTAYSWGKGDLGALGNRAIKDSLLPVMVGPYVIRTNERHIVLGKTDEFVLKGRTEYFNIISEPKIPMTAISKNTSVARISTLSDDSLTIEEKAKGYSAYKVEGIREGTTNLVLTESKTNSNGIIQVEVLPEAGITISPMVETNANHTVTLKTNGTVWTYGNNAYGQLGTGDITNYDEPQQVIFSDSGVELVKIKQIAIGEFHSVALDTNGNVWTWGRNNYYQLGSAGAEYSASPVKVTDIPKVVRIASGNNSVMAVTEDNKLVVWGQNAYGELGTGGYANRITPELVNGMHDVLDLQGGKNHYLILKTTGQIYTIGSNLYSQLGIDLGERTRTSTFEKIDLNAKFGSISASQSSNIAITIDGAAYKWGQNTLGNLGENKLNVSMPTQIQGLTGIVEADVGKTNTILRDYNNNVYIVGQNKYGQIGDGTTVDKVNYNISSDIEDVLRVSTGYTYTVVMKKDGTVWAWGDYNHGNNLLKSRTNSKVPIQIGSDTSSLDNLEIIIKKSEVASILANSQYQFNLIYEDKNSTSNFSYESLNVEVATVNDDGNILGIREGTTWVKVTDRETGKVNVAIVRVIDNVEGYLTYTAPKAATGENYVTVLKEDGNVDIWGYDGSDMVDSDLPYTLNIVATYQKIDSGKNHIAVLRNDGTVWTAGDNSYGQLGIGSNVTNTKLVQIQGLTDIEKIATGDNFCVAMDSYGILYVWGEGYGNAPQVVNTNIRNASYLSAGGKDQIVLVLPSGEVYGFGSMLNGLLNGIEDAVKVEVGENYLLILNTNGEVYRYQGGSLTKESTISNAVDISVSGNTNMYQKVNEKAYVWGDNRYGQLGTNDTANKSVPVQPVNNGNEVFTISAGNKNTYIVDIYGFVHSAGDNTYGQIGNGTKEDTTAVSYGRSLVHTTVGGRSFEVEPEEAVMAVNDTETLKIKGNTYNVFEKQKEKSASEYTFTSANNSIIQILEEAGNPTGKIKALAEGTTTVDIKDKVTNETKTIKRKVIPLDQNRIKTITADGNEAVGVLPSDAEKYVCGYETTIPMDDDQTLVTLNIITKDNTDSISIDGGLTYYPNGELTEQITFEGNTKVIEVTVKTSNGTEFLYELTLNRVSNNNKISSVTVNGFAAEESASEEDVYEVVITDLGTNQVKVIAENEKSKVSIKGQIAEEKQQTYDAVLKDGYLEVPFKVTSESGKIRNAWVRIYTEDRLLSLEKLTVNGTNAKLEEGRYKAVIGDDISRSKIYAKATFADSYVGINDSEKELREVTKSVITTQDETTATIKLEKQAKVDGVDKLITKEYTLKIYKNKVFTLVNEVKVNNEVLEEENNTYRAYVLSNVDTAQIEITAKDSSYTITFGEDSNTGTLNISRAVPEDVNTFTFTIDDGEETKAYTLIVERGSTDTKIKKITVGDGSYVVEAEKLDEKIGDIEVYEAKILDTHTNVDVTVQTANQESKIEINNSGVYTPRIAVENMNLSNKSTLVPINIKTADEATTKSYYLRILRQDDDVSIESIKATEGMLTTTATQEDETHYELQLQTAVSEITLEGITTSDYAKISINGEEEQTKTQSINLNITSSVTDVEIKVTSEAGTEKTYYLTIYTISDDTTLESVKVDGELATWNSRTGRYEIKVDRDKLDYVVTATTTHESAKVKVDGVEAVHQAIKTVTNETEETLVNIVVTAPNEITTATRKLAIIEKSANKEMGYVKVNGKAIAPDENDNYNVEVVSKVKSVLIEVGAQDANATVDIDSDRMVGVWKNSKTLLTDNETYNVRIIAEDGVTTSKIFKINIKRLDGNTDIDKIEVTYTKDSTDITKEPEKIDETTYYLKIPRIDEDRVALRVVLKQSKSTVNVFGDEGEGSIYGYVNLTGEKTIIPIVVVAEDGTREEYTLEIEKESTDTSIKEFMVEGITSVQNPVGYTITVDSKLDKINIRAVPNNSNAKIKFAEESDETYVSLLDNVEVDITGKDEILLQVLAEDGETTKIYIVNIVRTYDTTLVSVTLNGNVASLDNSVNVIDTDISTAELVVTATNTDAEIYLTKEGTDIGAGVGTLIENIDIAEETVYIYKIKVQGPDEYADYSTEYTLKVRKKSTNTNAGIYLDGTELTYNSETQKYEAVVVGGNHTLSVTKESTYAGVKIEEVERTSMQVLIEPKETKEYTVKVIAEDETEKEYRVKIYRKNNDTDIKEVNIKLTQEDEAEVLTALVDGSYYKKISRHQESVFVTLETKDENAKAFVNTENALNIVTKEVTIEGEITNVALKVIAEDGSENIVNLKLEKESNNTGLKELKYRKQVIAQAVDETYTISVDNRLTSIEIDATPTDSNAKLKVVGKETYVSTLIGENVDIYGKDYFEIEVLAEDGETTKTYRVNINRIFNTEILDVKVDVSEIVTVNDNNYSAYVSATAENHTIQIIPANELAIVTIYDMDDNELITGTGTITLTDSFAENSKTYKVKVKGPTGYEEYETNYTVTVIKRSQDTTAGIYVNNTLLTKDAETGKYKYITKVSNNTLKVETTNQFATVSIDRKGAKMHIAEEVYVVDIRETKEIEVVVTSQNGESERYEVEIVRYDNNTGISRITVNSAVANKVTTELYRSAQNKDVRSAQIVITPEYEMANVKAEVDSQEYTAVGELEFNITLTGSGTKEVKITVTAQDETEKEYTLNVVQNVSENMEFTVEVNNVEADKIDDSSYRIFVENASVSSEIHIYAEGEFTTIESGIYTGNNITFEKTLNTENDITLVPFSVTNELGHTNEYMLYIIKESNDNSVHKLYVNGLELTKGENGRYTTYIENTEGNPTVKVKATNEYAWVRIGTNERELQETTKVVELTENRKTTIPITVYSQSGIENVEYLDIITTFATGNIDTIIIDDVEVTEYDEHTKTYTALVESSLSEHEIVVVADNNYVTLELEGYVGLGSVTAVTAFEKEQEIKEMTLYVTGETDLTETYKIIIAQKSSNVELAQVKVNDVTLAEQENYIYRKNVDLGAKTVKVEVTAKYPYATVKVSDEPIRVGASGVVNLDIEVTQDEITIPVVVKAADGHTLKTYNIILTKKASTISGKVITENYEDKHIADIYVYRTSDKRKIDDELNPRELVYKGTSSEDGTYILNLPNADKYDLVFKKLGYLTYTITDVEAQAFTNVNVQPIRMKAGDVDVNNEIELDDLVELNDHIGEVVTDSNKIYDLNEDGKIDALDRKLIKNNYHKKAVKVKWINAAEEEMILPLDDDYVMTSDYGNRIHPITHENSFHTGVDLVGEHHGNIYAVLSGEVTYAGVQSGYGNCIEIKHEIDGVTVYSFYAHLSKIKVKVGDTVQQGDVIALEGGASTDPNPGSSTGHHLHFELRSASGSGHSLNPHDYIEL